MSKKAPKNGKQFYIFCENENSSMKHDSGYIVEINLLFLLQKKVFICEKKINF